MRYTCSADHKKVNEPNHSPIPGITQTITKDSTLMLLLLYANTTQHTPSFTPGQREQINYISRLRLLAANNKISTAKLFLAN